MSTIKWRSVPVSRLVSLNDDVLPESTDPLQGLNYIEISDVSLERGVRGFTQVAFENAPSRARRLVRAGDVVISTVRTYLRAVAAIDEEHDGFTASTGFAVLRPRKIHPGYLKYCVHGDDFIEDVIARSVGVSYPAINASDLIRISVRVPDSADKQRQIAAYLNRETGKIDELIAKQEQLVATLTERRQAVITQAVTRGLDSAVELTETGVLALSAIPKSWSLVHLKRLIASRSSGRSVNATDTPMEHGEFGVLKTSSVSTGLFKPRENKTVLDEEVRLLTGPVQSRTVLINRANSPAYVGAAAYVNEGQALPGLFLSDKVWQISLSKADPRFIAWWMQTNQYRDQVAFEIVGASSSMQNLSYEAFRDIQIAVPPITDQSAIADFVDVVTAQLDGLVAKSRQLTALLRERRQALISAAVTGKIDVRGL